MNPEASPWWAPLVAAVLIAVWDILKRKFNLVEPFPVEPSPTPAPAPAPSPAPAPVVPATPIKDTIKEVVAELVPALLPALVPILLNLVKQAKEEPKA